jgi:hypothetical protein
VIVVAFEGTQGLLIADISYELVIIVTHYDLQRLEVFYIDCVCTSNECYVHHKSRAL